MNKRKGISLIVLIITIVVIIILAAAVILTISKNNPVESAKKATFVSDLSSYQDELSMYIGNEYIKAQGNYNIASLDEKPLEEIVEIHNKYNGKFAIKDGKIVGTDMLTEQEKEWAESITGGTGSVTPPASIYPIEYTDTAGKRAYIPKGFIVSTVESEQKIDTGLVIKDESENEFVWIPVEYTSDTDFLNKFVKTEGYRNGVLQDVLKICIEPYSRASQSEIDEYNKMVDSIKKYQGYYVARYEISQDISGNAQSKPNVTPWVSISFGNSMIDLTNGAVEKSRAMYPVETATKGSAVSTLIYGIQWDLTLDFIKNYGVKNAMCRSDSAGKGNYSGSKINTGSISAYALNNIYDMAGNVWEWTMEATTNGYRIYRGGNYVLSSVYYPISCRDYSGLTVKMGNLGFRIALYIM